MLLGLGCLTRIACQRELGKFFTWELSVKEDQHLITTGPYSIVRHPSYTGAILISVGSALCHIGPGGWFREGGWLDTVGGRLAAAAWLGYLIAIPTLLVSRTPKEDKVLEEQFGNTWHEYAKKTQYRIVGSRLGHRHSPRGWLEGWNWTMWQRGHGCGMLLV